MQFTNNIYEKLNGNVIPKFKYAPITSVEVERSFY
jgi:hypothetical protein